MVYNDINISLIRINKDYPQLMLEIENKSILFSEDAEKIINNLT